MVFEWIWLLWQPLDTKSNSSTASKSQEGRYLVGIQVVYSQENLIGNHNSILLTIYIKYSWSMLQLCIVLLWCLCPVLMSITHLLCIFLKTTMPCPCTLTSYSLISITMCIPCIYYEEHLSLDITSNPRLFLILLDSKSFQTALDYSRPMISCHVTS